MYLHFMEHYASDHQRAFLLVILNHGPAHDEPEFLEQQLGMLNGACNSELADLRCFHPTPGAAPKCFTGLAWRREVRRPRHG